jgi:mRNA interferase MazF
MKRGEVWWVHLGSSTGGQIRKRRPAVIVSSDASNRHPKPRPGRAAHLVDRTRVYPSEAPVTVRRRRSKAEADQLATVAKPRLRDRLGRLSDADLRAVDHALCVQLDLLERTPR